MTLAILCSGQGNQHPDMFALTADAPAASEVFAAATRALDGRDPRQLVRETGAAIDSNRVGQVLCCTKALAAAAALRPKFGRRLIVAGYSVGELAAWGIAGVFTPDTVLDAAVERAAAMDAAAGETDGLAHVRGLNRERIDALCREYGVDVAIVNPGDLFVLGGTRPALQQAIEAAEAAGASQTGLLRVAVASHTPRMRDASERFRRTLSAFGKTPLPPSVRLLVGIDATFVRDLEIGLDKLAQQISHPIDWAGCLDACAEAGATTALELGPGHALASMAGSAFPDIKARSLEDFRSLAGVEHWLAAST